MKKIFLVTLFITFISLFASNIAYADNGTIPTPDTQLHFYKDSYVMLQLASDINRDYILDDSDKVFTTLDWDYEIRYNLGRSIDYIYMGKLNQLEIYKIPADKEVPEIEFEITIFIPTGETIKFTTNYTNPFEGEYIYLDSQNGYYQLDFTFSGTPPEYQVNGTSYPNNEVPIGATISYPCADDNDHFDCRNHVMTDKYIGVSDEYVIEEYSFDLIYPDKNSDWRLSCSHATNPEIIQFNIIGVFNQFEYNFDYCLKNRKVFMPFISYEKNEEQVSEGEFIDYVKP